MADVLQRWRDLFSVKGWQNVPEKTSRRPSGAEEKVGALCSGQADYSLCPVAGKLGMPWNDDKCMCDCSAGTGNGCLNVENGSYLVWVLRNMPCDCFKSFELPVLSKVFFKVGPWVFADVFVVLPL